MLLGHQNDLFFELGRECNSDVKHPVFSPTHLQMKNEIHENEKLTERTRLKNVYHDSSRAEKQLSHMLFRKHFRTLSTASFFDANTRNGKK